MKNSILYKNIWRISRIIRNLINRKKLINLNPTIISSDCNGSIILHDLGLKFRTPTINLFFSAKDFVKFVSNLDEYLSHDYELIELKTDYGYPVGLLKDIKIHFVHYNSFKEAAFKWNSRKKRINWDNIFLMMTDRNECDYEDIKKFDSLPYNKVIFTKQQYSDIKASVYIKGFENFDSVGDLSRKKHILGKRYVDDFDYVSFLNSFREA